MHLFSDKDKAAMNSQPTVDRSVMSRVVFCSLLVLFVLSVILPGMANAADSKKKKELEFKEWKELFDGKTLKNWKSTEFGGQGEVTVDEGTMLLEYGVELTGVTYTKPLPKNNFEVELEAQRVNGSDFFCGLTFMVDESPCSLIIGGWGGGLCGLSSIDGNDASENQTATYQALENEKWYRIRLRVHGETIQAWIDDKQIVDVETKGRKLTIRSEVELSKPFGFSTWKTTAALKNIRIREIKTTK